MDKTVLAIDPGTSKCGMALVCRTTEQTLRLIWHEVVPTEMVLPKLHQAYAAEPFHLIIIGSGTHSKPIVSTIREHLPSMGILVVDEKDTTLQARERYWEHHPRRGWRRLLPATLQVPPEPVDDFVAFILAERVLLGS
jgi:RNase H-fold protein (predicted Holliday junction resolvase)